ncbi:MAG TPA: ethanolamine ammonia-lyase reactivating factor EutA [Candidatus Acidoferrales bacterium]|nr:ethanolamine ammonia-lyase reactivating factor EutA [Candidatus Acidoferrales bacterium]
MELQSHEVSYRFHEGHDGEHEDHGDPAEFDENHPMWRSERIALTSVGIDIGSSTSHLIFSRLILRRQGIALSSRFVVVSREIVYESPIMLTPYVDKTTIDTQRLDAFIREAYRQSGLTPDMIDTGAVIVTGEAAKKKNAEAIAALFSAQAGKFVCATAGHNLEALLAAYGSGAVRLTREEPGDITVMNVDIGGGTSKIAVVKGGDVVDTAALEVGARLVAMDARGRIDRLEDAGEKIGRAAGVALELGGALRQEEKDAMASVLCACLFEVLERRPLSPLTRSLMLTPEISFREPIDVITFSGGVSEYIYGFEKRNLGDLGNELGFRVRERAKAFPGKVEFKMPDVRIRATVIGASQYTVQVSGNTIFLSHPDLLPLRNLQVITPQIEQRETLNVEDVKAAVTKALQRFDMHDGERAAALAIHWEIGPSYPLIRTLAEGVAAAMRDHVDRGHPLVMVFDADIAKLVGNIIDKEIAPGAGIISIDGIDLRDFDFIDIGAELPDAKAVPVVIKSLIFRHAERGRGHLHHHHHH